MPSAPQRGTYAHSSWGDGRGMAVGGADMEADGAHSPTIVPHNGLSGMGVEMALLWGLRCDELSMTLIRDETESVHGVMQTSQDTSYCAV